MMETTTQHNCRFPPAVEGTTAWRAARRRNRAFDRARPFRRVFHESNPPDSRGENTNYEFCSNDPSAGGATAQLDFRNDEARRASPRRLSRRTSARAARRSSKLGSSSTISRGESRGRRLGRSRERVVRAQNSRNNSRDNGPSRRTLTRWVFSRGVRGDRISRATRTSAVAPRPAYQNPRRGEAQTRSRWASRPRSGRAGVERSVRARRVSRGKFSSRAGSNRSLLSRSETGARR